MLKRLILFSFLVFHLFMFPAQGFERKILFEDFWGYWSPACATAWPVFYEWYNSSPQKENTVVIQYHSHSGSDPWGTYSFYDTIRNSYYTVGTRPTCIVDGTYSGPTDDMNFIQGSYDNRNLYSSPLKVTINSHLENEEEIFANVRVEFENNFSEDSLKLYCGIMSNYVESGFYWPSNGQEEFAHDIIDFAPDAHGIELEIDPGEVVENNFTFDWSIVLEYSGQTLELEENNISVFAFVQNSMTGEVLNSNYVPLGNAHYYVGFEEVSQLIEKGESLELDLELNNYDEDTLQIDLSFNIQIPSSWNLEFTSPDGIQNGDYTFTLPGESQFLSEMTITTSDDMRFTKGIIEVSYNPSDKPEEQITKTIFLVMCDEVLHINAATDADYSTMYANAFANLTSIGDYSISCWDKNRAVINFDEIMEIFPEIIIWSTGGLDRLESDEVTFLEEYLNAGGNLWLSGSLVTRTIYHADLLDMLGAEFNGYYEAGDEIFGVDDDPYFTGISTPICGGDGANNTELPIMLTEAGGVTCLRYNLVRRCGIRNETDTYKTLLFSFPFEAIASEDSRIDVMRGAISFLSGYEAGIKDDIEYLPESFVLNQNYPNPFNSSTRINFYLPETADIIVTIFDVTGREVETIIDHKMSGGWHNFSWDAQQKSSGIYFCHINAVGYNIMINESKKMILLK